MSTLFNSNLFQSTLFSKRYTKQRYLFLETLISRKRSEKEKFQNFPLINSSLWLGAIQNIRDTFLAYFRPPSPM